MASPFTVLTATIPGRQDMLAEAAASLYAQTVWPVPWLMRMDQPEKFSSRHLAEQLNTLLKAVETEWVALLDDDDLLDPTYLEVMAQHLEGADVVYSYCRDRGHIQRGFDPETSPGQLRHENWIDGECCIRVEAIREVGGWPEDTSVNDWYLWHKMLDAGKTFRCVPQELRNHRKGAWRTLTP